MLLTVYATSGAAWCCWWLCRKITEKVSSVTIMLKKYQASQMPSSNEQHLAREPKVPDPCITAWYLGDFLRDMQKVEWKTRATVCRFLCKVKHASWKLWDEEPKSYQVSPLFDVIRLVRFKERMKGCQFSPVLLWLCLLYFKCFRN